MTNQKKAEATERPWHIVEEFTLRIAGKDGSLVAGTRTIPDAELIVQAVNCHDELIATIKDLLNHGVIYGDGQAYEADPRNALQVIARAEGKGE